MLDPSKLSLPETLMMKAMKAAHVDFCDWAAITSWAAGIVEALKKCA